VLIFPISGVLYNEKFFIKIYSKRGVTMVKPIDLEGRVVHDPILKKTKTGKSVCTFAIVLDYPTKGETKPYPSYIDIETWDKLADLCAEHIKKGRLVQATGRLKQDRWQGEDGKTRSKIKLVTKIVKFIDPITSSKNNEEVVLQP